MGLRVVGTAGHVDHGKSSLVRRLTNIDPDRLAEEKAREMTIDLGFAWLSLPDGDMLGIVDVPGHRDFIENMLAGVGGIDAVLFVVAADEGIMPQTREHLAILDLLDIRHGLIVLTKIDLIDDPDWLELIESDVRATFAHTTLADTPILPVSSQTGMGIPALLQAISDLIVTLPPRPDIGAPRLPIDRVFTMTGFGTVVTGTLNGGALRVGDEVEIQPRGLHARVRTLQSYRQGVQIAYPGGRVAVNLAGIDKDALARGDVLAHLGQLAPTNLIDVQFRHLPDAAHPLKHNTEVKVFTGAAEIAAQARLLGTDALAPGETGWLQLVLAAPLAVTRGDRFILRRPSPAETIGGGVIVDPHPARRWRRFKPEIIAALELRLTGTPAEHLAVLANSPEPLKRAALQQAAGLNTADFAAALAAAVDSGLLAVMLGDTYWSTERIRSILNAITRELDVFHRTNPLRLGMPREALRSRVGLKLPHLTAVLSMQSDVVGNEQTLRLASHEIRFSPQQQQQIARLSAIFEAAPYTPPSLTEAAQIVTEDVLEGLIDLGEIVRIQPDIILARQVYDEMVAAVLEIIEGTGSVTAAALRDRFNTSRKYAIGLLEHLDTLGMTRRVGDARVRR